MKIIKWVKTKNVSNVPEHSGVYLIARNCKSGKDCVVYTGQASNLNNRLQNHFSDSETNVGLKKAIITHRSAFVVFYAEVESQLDKDGIEKYLFVYFEPQFGERKPDVDPIEVNLPNVSKANVNFK